MADPTQQERSEINFDDCAMMEKNQPRYLPREKLENVQICDDRKDDDEKNENQRQWLQDADQNSRGFRHEPLDEKSNGEWDQQTGSHRRDPLIWNAEVGAVENCFAERENPQRHHRERRERGDRRHRDGEIDVAAEQKRPHVARSTARRYSGEEQPQRHFVRVLEERQAQAVGSQRHEHELTDEADRGSNWLPHDVFDRRHVDGGTEVDVQNRHQNDDRVHEEFVDDALRSQNCDFEFFCRFFRHVRLVFDFHENICSTF